MQRQNDVSTYVTGGLLGLGLAVVFCSSVLIRNGSVHSFFCLINIFDELKLDLVAIGHYALGFRNHSLYTSPHSVFLTQV
jgi:hypothetical protein